MLPIALASFLFDVLVLSATDKDNKHPVSKHYKLFIHICVEQLDTITIKYCFQQARSPNDETLGFEAAVAALGLKANVSEADHPLLCEGTRRQRGELSLTLLSFYKDDPVKLARIMNKVRMH